MKMERKVAMSFKKRLLGGLLAAVLALSPLAALADDSTTTTEGAAKDLSANTEIYTVTSTPGESHPTYGAMYEPQGGVLYGRTAHGGTLPSGQFGLGNKDAMADESIVSHYYGTSELLGEHSLEYWKYLFGGGLEDGEHAFLVYLNFDYEGNDCPNVMSGKYDAALRTTFQYLSTLEMPVFMRVGGEVNVWTIPATPEDYIAAYRHIVDIGHSVAPNVAFIFSPNYGSSYQVDMDAFYPGDEYVDWLGVSLYYSASTGSPNEDRFRGRGDVYGDAVLNAQQIVNLSKLHNKPVMVTEGGAFNTFGGSDYTDWAVERIHKAYAYLPMVYPQIKAIVASDYKHGDEDYIFSDKPAITNAIKSSVDAVGVYRTSYSGTGKYMTPLSDSPALTDDPNITFFAYTRSPKNLTATWTLDDQVVGTSTEHPYSVSVAAGSIASGEHTLAVTFNNKETKSYAIQNGTVVGGAVEPEASSGWAAKDVDRADKLGLVPTAMKQQYGQPTTRAEFCDLAVRLYEYYKGAEIEGRVTFTDTNDENIEKMAYLGVVNGTGDGKFDPNGQVTREQASKMLAILAELLGKKMGSTTLFFLDTDEISPWAVEYVSMTLNSGVMSGLPGPIFSPKTSYTREQSIVTIMRIYKYLKGIDINS